VVHAVDFATAEALPVQRGGCLLTQELHACMTAAGEIAVAELHAADEPSLSGQVDDSRTRVLVEDPPHLGLERLTVVEDDLDVEHHERAIFDADLERVEAALVVADLDDVAIGEA